MEQKHKGAFNELLATTWLLKQGYEVFRNISQHGAVDLVATKSGEILFVDVKAVQQSRDGRVYHQKYTYEQQTRGVKFLYVFGDGTCAFDAR